MDQQRGQIQYLIEKAQELLAGQMSFIGELATQVDDRDATQRQDSADTSYNDKLSAACQTGLVMALAIQDVLDFARMIETQGLPGQLGSN